VFCLDLLCLLGFCWCLVFDLVCVYLFALCCCLIYLVLFVGLISLRLLGGFICSFVFVFGIVCFCLSCSVG